MCGGGALVHTWRWGEPNHGPAEIPTNGEEWGMGAVPGVTHLKTLKKAFHSSDTSAPHLIMIKNNLMCCCSSFLLRAKSRPENKR